MDYIDLTVWVDFLVLSDDESLASLQVHVSLCLSSNAFKPTQGQFNPFASIPHNPIGKSEWMKFGLQ